ncbi:MAG TPA: hypothetical protein PK636_09935, partial [bacterium]|nr:hypothetical protein [bacterium]
PPARRHSRGPFQLSAESVENASRAVDDDARIALSCASDASVFIMYTGSPSPWSTKVFSTGVGPGTGVGEGLGEGSGLGEGEGEGVKAGVGRAVSPRPMPARARSIRATPTTSKRGLLG